jgi:hypothetical protein
MASRDKDNSPAHNKSEVLYFILMSTMGADEGFTSLLFFDQPFLERAG